MICFPHMNANQLKELEERLSRCLEQVKDLNRLYLEERRTATERRLLMSATLKDPNHQSLPEPGDSP